LNDVNIFNIFNVSNVLNVVTIGLQLFYLNQILVDLVQFAIWTLSDCDVAIKLKTVTVSLFMLCPCFECIPLCLILLQFNWVPFHCIYCVYCIYCVLHLISSTLFDDECTDSLIEKECVIMISAVYNDNTVPTL